jgi:hypothetical protein
LIAWYRAEFGLYVVCSFGAGRVLRQAYAFHDQKDLTSVNNDTIYLHSRTSFRRSPTQGIDTEVKIALTHDVHYATEDSRDTDERDRISIYDHRVLL